MKKLLHDGDEMITKIYPAKVITECYMVVSTMLNLCYSGLSQIRHNFVILLSLQGINFVADQHDNDKQRVYTYTCR
jgi:hypothetical protein